MVKRIILIILSLSIYGCNHLDLKGIFIPTGEGVEKRFEQSMKMNKDLKAGEIHAQGSYTFYVAADPHIDETHKNLDAFNNTFSNIGLNAPDVSANGSALSRYKVTPVENEQKVLEFSGGNNEVMFSENGFLHSFILDV